MTRRDYIELAAALKLASEGAARTPDLYDAGFTDGVRAAARAVADVCARDPVFNRERFLKKAGVKSCTDTTKGHGNG